MIKFICKIFLCLMSIAYMIWGLMAFVGISNGGTVTLPAEGGGEVSGAGGLLMAVFFFGLGTYGLKGLRNRAKNRDSICSSSEPLKEYPYCRWWQNEEEWYDEHNPMMKVKYPENHICPVCKKKIEKIEYVLREER